MYVRLGAPSLQASSVVLGRTLRRRPPTRGPRHWPQAQVVVQTEATCLLFGVGGWVGGWVG